MVKELKIILMVICLKSFQVYASNSDISRVFWTGDTARPPYTRYIFDGGDMCKTQDGNIVVTYDRNACRTTESYRDSRIEKLTPDLKPIWTKTFSGSYTVKVIPSIDSGIILIDDCYIYRYNGRGDTLWTKDVSCGIGDVIMDSDSTLLLATGPALNFFRLDLKGNLIDTLDTTGLGTSKFIKIATDQYYYYLCDEFMVRKIDRNLHFVKEMNHPSISRYATFFFQNKENGFIITGSVSSPDCMNAITIIAYDSAMTQKSIYTLCDTIFNKGASTHFMTLLENDTILAIGNLIGESSGFIAKFHPSFGWKMQKIAKMVDSEVLAIARTNDNRFYLYGDTNVGGNVCAGYVWISILNTNWKGVPSNINFINEPAYATSRIVSECCKYDLSGKLLPTKVKTGAKVSIEIQKFQHQNENIITKKVLY